MTKHPMKFSTEDMVFKSFTGNGGDGGCPAVILLDTAFLSPDNRRLLPQKLAKYVGRGMQAWRVIEISPDYCNIGYCSDAMSAQGLIAPGGGGLAAAAHPPQGSPP